MKIETSVGQIEVADEVFNTPYKEALVHQVLGSFIDKAHSGSKAQKTRAAVSGGGRKPWRQKGTGNARAGSNRSPIWRGGGRAFAASPESRTLKLNKKMYRGAMCSLISEIYRRGGLQVIDAFGIDQPKTKLLAEKLKALVDDASVLIVTENEDRNITLSANNLPSVGVITAGSLDPFSLLRFDKIVFTKEALKKFEERLA